MMSKMKFELRYIESDSLYIHSLKTFEFVIDSVI